MGYIGKITDTAGSTHLVGSTLYGTCSTATATAAKVVTCSDYVEEVEGVTIHVHFTNKNTAGCTLNVNSKGAHTCVGCDGIPGSWEDDSVASFTLVKDGNTFYWYQNNLYWEGGSDTKVTQTATTTNSDYPILFKNSANQTAETDRVRYGNTTNKIPKINPSTGNLSAGSFNGVEIYVNQDGSFGFINPDTYGGFLEVPSGCDGGSLTDEKVKQTGVFDNSFYPLLFKNSTSQSDERAYVHYSTRSGSQFPSVNPYTGDFRGTAFNDVLIEHSTGGTHPGIQLYNENTGTVLLIPSTADYTLGAACEKGVDASIPSSGWSTTNVPTTAAVANYIASAISGGNAFMGSLVASGGNGSTTWTDAQVQASSYTRGQYWVCSAAGTYCGNVLEAGDMLFCVNDKASAYSASDFSAVQNNIETLTTTEVSNLWTAAVAVS